MYSSNKKQNKFGKKAALTVAGLFAALSLALGCVIDAPEELFSGTSQSAQVVISASASNEYARTSAAGKAARKARLQNKLRNLMFAQPSIVRGAVLLPFWAVGKALLTALPLLFTALSPVLQVVLGVLLNALLLFGLFVVVLKLIFPRLRLRHLLTKRNVILLTMGTILLSVTDAILRASWEDYQPISIAIKLGVALIVLALLCWRIFGNRARKQAIA